MESAIGSILVWLFVLAVYFIPTYVAAKRQHKNAGAVMMLNLFLGWSLIGWVVALVWANTSNIREEEKSTEEIMQNVFKESIKEGSFMISGKALVANIDGVNIQIAEFLPIPNKKKAEKLREIIVAAPQMYNLLLEYYDESLDDDFDSGDFYNKAHAAIHKIDVLDRID